MTTSEHPPVITVGRLRQNPTEALRGVRGGQDYVVTDHGTPIARLVPLTEQQWVTRERALDAFRSPGDITWKAELQAQRTATDMEDPFNR